MVKLFIKKILIIGTIVIVSFNFGFGQGSGAASIVGNFVTINPDIRSSGMGNANIASTSHPNDIFNNSSKLQSLDKKVNLALNYTPWFYEITSSYGDLYLAALGASYKINENSSVYTALRYFTYGKFNNTDDQGNTLATFVPYEVAFDVGYLRRLSSKLSIGAAFRLINSQLFVGQFNGQTYTAGQAYALNFNFTYNQRPDQSGLSAGFVLNNIGSKLSYTGQNASFIPANLGIGVGYNFQLDPDNQLNLALDLNKLLVPAAPVLNITDTSAQSFNNYRTAIQNYNNQGPFEALANSFSGNNFGNSIKANFGLEYNYNKIFYARAGYTIQPIEGNFYTFGLGVKAVNINLNVSYWLTAGNTTFRNPLNNTIQFGLNYSF